MTHICISKLSIFGSDNGLSPDRRQAIIWTNAGILLIGPLGTNFSETLIEILTSSVKKMRMKVLSAKRRQFCLGLNVLKIWQFQKDWKEFRKNLCYDPFAQLAILLALSHWGMAYEEPISQTIFYLQLIFQGYIFVLFYLIGLM